MFLRKLGYRRLVHHSIGDEFCEVSGDASVTCASSACHVHSWMPDEIESWSLPMPDAGHLKEYLLSKCYQMLHW